MLIAINPETRAHLQARAAPTLDMRQATPLASFGSVSSVAMAPTPSLSGTTTIVSHLH